MAASGTATLTPVSHPADGRGRSSGPGCAAPVAAALAARRCTMATFRSATRERTLLASFYRPCSSRSSWQILAGLQTGLTAVDAESPASVAQSADLGERAVSLGRDYIDVIGTGSPLARRSWWGDEDLKVRWDAADCAGIQEQPAGLRCGP